MCEWSLFVNTTYSATTPAKQCLEGKKYRTNSEKRKTQRRSVINKLGSGELQRVLIQLCTCLWGWPLPFVQGREGGQHGIRPTDSYRVPLLLKSISKGYGTEVLLSPCVPWKICRASGNFLLPNQHPVDWKRTRTRGEVSGELYGYVQHQVKSSLTDPKS